MFHHQMIRGIPFQKLSIFNKEDIEKTMDYLPKDGDIIIASYPKTGTIWLSYIVLQVVSKGQSFPSFDQNVYQVAPCMEIVKPETIENLTGVRVYKHHYRYDMVKKNPKSKVLFIYRHPADALLSYYHFYEALSMQKLDLDDFFNRYISGNITHGSYFEHVMSFLAHKKDDNLLMVSYEELHNNPKEGILRIAKFLGEEYYQKLSTDESLLDTVLEHTSFDYMKKNLILDHPLRTPKKSPSEEPKETFNFFRKGAVGDGKSSLSPEQVQKLREVATEVMKGSEVLQEWFKD